ncbi:unnamed protein product [Ambrosiozyma monospora]|uniref:Unnamed protein product n=1 Tax=Ambrosiozyma monospora TaxID=43982 RepID=A0ACB5TAG7_AMBMO|nr:unnamed protein product [Ambrosiozyma monospora]
MLKVLKRCYSTATSLSRAGATTTTKRTASKLIKTKPLINGTEIMSDDAESMFKLCGMHETVARLKLEPKEFNDILKNASSELSKFKYEEQFHNSENYKSSLEKPATKSKIMSNSSSSEADVLEIIRSLPFEVRCLVLKHAILKRIRWLCGSLWWTEDQLYPYEIVNLIGYNSILDDIMVLVLQELSFDSTIFNHVCFNDIAEFIISRSISMKHLTIVGGINIKHTPNMSAFIQRFQEVTLWDLKEELPMSLFKGVTSLEISGHPSLPVLQAVCGGLKNFPRLVYLNVSNIGGSLEKDTKNCLMLNSKLPLNLTFSSGMDLEHINLLKKLVEKWRASTSGVPNARQKQKSLKI